MQSPKTAKTQTFLHVAIWKTMETLYGLELTPPFLQVLYTRSHAPVCLFFSQQLTAFHLTDLEQYLPQVNLGMQTEAAKVWTTNFPTSTWPAQPPVTVTKATVQFTTIQMSYLKHNDSEMSKPVAVACLTIIVVKQATTTLWKKCRFRVHSQWEWAGQWY